jgi:hypothetical protein
VKLHKCSVCGVQAFIVFHITVDKGCKAENDKHEKVAVVLVGRALHKMSYLQENEILRSSWLLQNEKSPLLVILDLVKMCDSPKLSCLARVI